MNDLILLALLAGAAGGFVGSVVGSIVTLLLLPVLAGLAARAERNHLEQERLKQRQEPGRRDHW
jgi:predicted Na+-dependent transporter